MRDSGGGPETHFAVRVVSEAFTGQRQLQRHRTINNALSEEFAAGLHALEIRAQTPAEADATS